MHPAAAIARIGRYLNDRPLLVAFAIVGIADLAGQLAMRLVA